MRTDPLVIAANPDSKIGCWIGGGTPSGLHSDSNDKKLDPSTCIALGMHRKLNPYFLAAKKIYF